MYGAWPNYRKRAGYLQIQVSGRCNICAKSYYTFIYIANVNHLEMLIEIDEVKGREAAKLLYDTFNSEGVFARKEMPEDLIPNGISIGSLEHILFITMTVSIDYRRNATAMWKSAKATYEDEETRYLFNPKAVSQTPLGEIESDMRKHGLSAKPRKDPAIWKTVGTSFAEKWGGNPLALIKDCGWDAMSILKRLKDGSHEHQGKRISDFPYLRGDKIGPLWLRMLKDTCLVTDIQGLEQCPVPVDVHVARATINIGVITGQFEGRMEALYPSIRNAWFKSVEGLQAVGRPMVALDVDNPLWHLSKYGCTKRTMDRKCGMSRICPVRDLCIGKDAAMVQGDFVKLSLLPSKEHILS